MIRGWFHQTLFAPSKKTPAVNFINVFRARFLSFFCQNVPNFGAKNALLYKKTRTIAQFVHQKSFSSILDTLKRRECKLMK